MAKVTKATQTVCYPKDGCRGCRVVVDVATCPHLGDRIRVWTREDSDCADLESGGVAVTMTREQAIYVADAMLGLAEALAQPPAIKKRAGGKGK